jgi:hypothetical protein
MKAFIMTNESEITNDEKLQRLKFYTVIDLLYVVREFENDPVLFPKEIMKCVFERLIEHGITCI